jgi:hypothetical protein
LVVVFAVDMTLSCSSGGYGAEMISGAPQFL